MINLLADCEDRIGGYAGPLLFDQRTRLFDQRAPALIPWGPTCIYIVDMEAAMNAHVRRWGNSAAVRIPAAMLEALGLKLDDPVDVREEGGRIVIEPAVPKKANLEVLVARITPENRHDETDWGLPRGAEIW